MTVTATNRKNQFSTNGVTTEFTFDFAITDVSQVYALTVDDDGTETVFENFTAVKSEVIEGGTLTTNEVLSGVYLLIYRDTALTQQVDYESGGKFPADSHEQALDKLTLQNQDQQEELDRTLKSSISNDDPYTVGKLESGFMLASVGSEIVSTSITEGDLEIAKGNEITMIARSLNALNTQVICSTDTTTVLDDVLYIYDASEQVTYAVPEAAQGKFISSVVDGVLTTTDTSEFLLTAVNDYLVYKQLGSKSAVSCMADGSSNVGSVVSTGGTTWLRVSAGGGLSDFKPLSDLFAVDFGFQGTVTESEFDFLESSLVSLGVKNIHLVFTDELNYSGAHGSLVTLSNLSLFKVTGLVLTDLTEYVGSFDITTIFDIADTKTVDIDCDITSTLTTIDGNKRGIVPIKFYRGSKFKFNGIVNKCYEGWVTQDVKHLDVDIVSIDTRYPNHAFRKNGIININATCEGSRRDVFIVNGCTGGNIIVNSKDQALTSLVKHYISDEDPAPEAVNLDVKAKVRDTGRYPHGDRTSYFDLEISRDSSMTETVTPAKFRNINITYDLADSDRGSVIGLRKLIDDGVGDTIGRGYIMQNINLSGRVELGSDNTCFFFNWKDSANWVTGDVISNFNIDKLTVLDRSSSSIAFNPEIVMGAITSPDHMQCDNFTAPSMTISSTVDYNDKIHFTNTELLGYTTRGASPYSEANARGAGWIKNSTDGVFKIGEINNYRTVTAIEIRVTANYPADGLTGSIAGRFVGNLAFASSPTATTSRVVWIPDVDVGVTVNPTITVSGSGEVYVNMPEWAGQDIHASFDVVFNYNGYSSQFNSSVRGLISDKFKVME